MSKYDELTDFNNDVKNTTTQKLAGNIDAANKRYLVECKESITHNTLTNGDIIKQIDKYINPESPNFMNVGNKKVVLAIKELTNISPNHKTLKLLGRKGVIIITDINQIKNLK